MIDFVSGSLSFSLETFPDLIPWLQSEVLPGLQDAAREQQKLIDEAIGKKTEQVTGMVGMVLIPVALILGAFIIKVIYGAFTSTADGMAGGVGKLADSIQSAYYKARYGSGEEEEEWEEEEPEEPGASPKDMDVIQPTVMLFGEIVRKYVLDSLSDEDLEKALAWQKSDANGRKLGEIMTDLKLVTRLEVNQALKIQERQRQKAAG